MVSPMPVLSVLSRGRQRLEYFEYFFEVLFFDSAAVVGDAEFPEVVFFGAADFDLALRFISIFDGVAQKVLEDLFEPEPFAANGGHVLFDNDFENCPG